MAKKDQPMVVVAKRRGYYPNTVRLPGERFALTKAEHFSKIWMLDPNRKEHADEAKQLEREFNANLSRSQADVSDEQILQELARATGSNVAAAAEAQRLKARVAELETLLTESQKDVGKQAEEAPTSEESDDAGKGQEEPAEGGAAEEVPAAVTRRTRRTQG